VLNVVVVSWLVAHVVEVSFCVLQTVTVDFDVPLDVAKVVVVLELVFQVVVVF